MSKWKCDICNSSFENFDARGFDNKIYCPLCYYKKLYTDTELERERLNKELEKYKYSADELNEIERLNNIINDIDRYIHNFKLEDIGEKTMLILNDILLIKNGMGNEVVRLNGSDKE